MGKRKKYLHFYSWTQESGLMAPVVVSIQDTEIASSNSVESNLFSNL